VLNTAAVNALRSRIQAEIDDGPSQAAQFALGLNGEIVAAESFGTATADSRFVIFSATKAIVAVSLLPHLADGSIELTAPVARYLPGFGDNGKEASRSAVADDARRLSAGADRTRFVGNQRRPAPTVRRVDVGMAVGHAHRISPDRAHWVIAELIETMSGRPYASDQRTRPPPPGCRTCSARARIDTVGPVVTIRTAGSVPDYEHLLAEFGRPDLVPDTTVSAGVAGEPQRSASAAAAIPGGGGIARAVDMATIYQSFLHNPGDAHPPIGWPTPAAPSATPASSSTTGHPPIARSPAWSPAWTG
jgi:hypothetical protein